MLQVVSDLGCGLLLAAYPFEFIASLLSSGRHTNSRVLLVSLVASLVRGCGREVCALLLLSETATGGGEGSLGAPERRERAQERGRGSLHGGGVWLIVVYLEMFTSSSTP